MQAHTSLRKIRGITSIANHPGIHLLGPVLKIQQLHRYRSLRSVNITPFKTQRNRGNRSQRLHHLRPPDCMLRDRRAHFRLLHDILRKEICMRINIRRTVPLTIRHCPHYRCLIDRDWARINHPRRLTRSSTIRGISNRRPRSFCRNRQIETTLVESPIHTELRIARKPIPATPIDHSRTRLWKIPLLRGS